MFVAQGLIGRKVVSCDEGRTWTASQSLDDGARCGGGYDCDHHPGSPMGIVFHNGWFVSTWGWGKPGSVQRSRDGVNWETLLTGNYFGGIASSGDRLFLAATEPQISSDDGTTFTKTSAGAYDLTGATVRRVAYAPNGDGSIILVGNGGSQVAVSFDSGASWQRPSQIDNRCGESIVREGGIAYGNGVLSMVSYNGTACRSTDGGRTFSLHSAGGEVSSTLLWDGQAFLGWGQGARRRSVDGANWETTPIQPSNLKLGAVGRSDSGVFVGVKWGDTNDADVAFFRSEDGIQWERLATDAFAAGHPIISFAYGRVPANDVCTGK
jgi:hypothetical protein